jgi:hypothetical protein
MKVALDRAARAPLLALCWIGFVMVFFTFSTTQEYYLMPIIQPWRWRPLRFLWMGGDVSKSRARRISGDGRDDDSVLSGSAAGAGGI